MWYPWWTSSNGNHCQCIQHLAFLYIILHHKVVVPVSSIDLVYNPRKAFGKDVKQSRLILYEHLFYCFKIPLVYRLLKTLSQSTITVTALKHHSRPSCLGPACNSPWWDCSWFHPVWPPLKWPDRDSTICVVNRTSTKLICCIHRVFYVGDMYKPHQLVWKCCWDIDRRKLQMMKPIGDEANCRDTFAQDEAHWVWIKLTPHLRRESKHSNWLLIIMK